MVTTERTIHSPDRRVRKYRIVARNRAKSTLQVAWEESWAGDRVEYWRRRRKTLTLDELRACYTGAPPL